VGVLRESNFLVLSIVYLFIYLNNNDPMENVSHFVDDLCLRCETHTERKIDLQQVLHAICSENNEFHVLRVPMYVKSARTFYD
jgi:hypothetical protein